MVVVHYVIYKIYNKLTFLFHLVIILVGGAKSLKKKKSMTTCHCDTNPYVQFWGGFLVGS